MRVDGGDGTNKRGSGDMMGEGQKKRDGVRNRRTSSVPELCGCIYGLAYS